MNLYIQKTEQDVGISIADESNHTTKTVNSTSHDGENFWNRYSHDTLIELCIKSL